MAKPSPIAQEARRVTSETDAARRARLAAASRSDLARRAASRASSIERANSASVFAFAAASRKEVAEEMGGMLGQPSNAGAGILGSAGGGVRAERTDSGLGALDRENQEQPERNAARIMRAAGRIVGLTS
jgi:hypothetical protein